MREYTPSWRTDPALYSARCRRVRESRERRLDRLANRVFLGSVALFVWAASVAAVVMWV